MSSHYNTGADTETLSPIAEMRSLGESAKPAHKSINISDREILFDTINIQFHFRTFFTQLLAHLVLPLFFVLANLHGQIGKGIMNFLGAFIAPTCLYVMLVAYSQIPDPIAAGIEWAFLIPMVYFLQHRTVIAMKYASMSPTEYRKFMGCKDPDLCERYLHQMQLVQGWYSFNPDVARFELAAASARIGARINQLDLWIADPDSSALALNQLRAWNAFLRGHDVVDYASPPCKQLRRQKDGSYALSVFDLCEGLLLHADKGRPSTDAVCFWVTNIFNIINLSIPIIMVTCAHRHVAGMGAAGQAWLVVFLFTSSLLNQFYAQLFYLLLFTAVADVLRQLNVMQTLDRIARLTDICMDVQVTGRGQQPHVSEGTTPCQKGSKAGKMKETGAEGIGEKGYWECEAEQQQVHQHVAEIMSIAERPAGQGERGGPGEGREAEAAEAEREGSEHRHQERDKPGGSGNGRFGAGSTPRRSAVMGERVYKDNEAPLLPRLDLQHGGNITGWVHARLAMQHFGERFHFRMELYVIASIAMLVLLVVLGLVSSFLAADRMALMKAPWFLQTLVSVTMCIAFNAIIMQCGAQVNDTLLEHGHTLSKHSLQVHRKIDKLGKLGKLVKGTGRVDGRGEGRAAAGELGEAEVAARREGLMEVAECLGEMREVLEESTELRPYRVFGFAAQSSLTTSILSAAVSFYGVLFSVIFSGSGSGSGSGEFGSG